MRVPRVLSYLQYALLHRIFVVGFRRNLMSEHAMAEFSEMAPVSLTLNDYRVTLDNGRWCSECADRGSAAPRSSRGPDDGSYSKEITRLRSEKRRLTQDLERYKRETRDMDDLKERWSKLDFKYQLLMDMWTLRALDEKPPSRATTPRG